MEGHSTDTPETREAPPSSPASSPLSLRRALPLIVIALGAAAAIFFARDYLSFTRLQENQQALTLWRDANYTLAILTYMGIYVLCVTFSVPGATWLTITGGFLFGLYAGTAITVLAATLGATAIFFAAKTGLGDALQARAGPFVRKMEAGIRENEVSFLLVMRLVPAVPFFIANLAPAFLGVRPLAYIWTTFLGIIPGTAVYTSIGAGLGEILARGETPDLSIIWSWPVLGPLLGLAALAMLPLIVKRLRKRRGAS